MRRRALSRSEIRSGGCWGRRSGRCFFDLLLLQHRLARSGGLLFLLRRRRLLGLLFLGTSRYGRLLLAGGRSLFLLQVGFLLFQIDLLLARRRPVEVEDGVIVVIDIGQALLRLAAGRAEEEVV